MYRSMGSMGGMVKMRSILPRGYKVHLITLIIFNLIFKVRLDIFSECENVLARKAMQVFATDLSETWRFAMTNRVTTGLLRHRFKFLSQTRSLVFHIKNKVKPDFT